MSFKASSKKEDIIIAAMGRGVIPSGGESFKLGAADLEDKWLPRTDYMLSRMTKGTQFGLRLACHAVNYLWPLIFAKGFKPMTSMEEDALVEMFRAIDHSSFPGPYTLLLVKILVFLPFYGLDEAKQAIGYTEKFSNHPDFEGIKA